ncbi:uncharacterized protein LOC109711650 [Ananas comosus]|uniref:Uncharacterized protein LOC109711650 n=1 Tax=Ananas comosus TaxID=4615 RepID=A0A6P5F419_ANACO|nr:uncharacterized protein LOC109711650 [Ananas comosus]
MAQEPSSAAPSPSLDDTLRLLRGDRDEQKLAGLLLASKLCGAGGDGADADAVIKVYRAVGPRFLSRLLITGMGKGAGDAKGAEEREAYLRLAISVLAAFARVPEIASSEGMVSEVPLVAEIVSKAIDQSIVEECYEFLLLVALASEDGRAKFYEPGVLDLLASHILNLPDGSRSLELAVRLLELLVNKLTIDMMNDENLQGIASMVASLARLFAVLHNAIKFDALHMLSVLLSQKDTPLHDALRSMPSRISAAHIRTGITAILQNRVVSSEKLQALLLAECMMSILGENWLLEQTNIPEEQKPMPVEKFLLLVLESARIEVAVLLNELAYSKYELSKSSSNAEEAIKQKQRSLAIPFSLIEKIVKLISNVSGAEGLYISESTITKAIAGLNETINAVLDFLQDSKDHGQRKGDDLLAAVRIIGSYLAEAPYACNQKTRDLLEYILSVEGEDESSPFYSVCFMLPMLCQITMEVEGCKTLVSFGGHRSVVNCLIKMIEQDAMMVEDNGTIFLACDTILNFLSNRTGVQVQLEPHFVNLLRTLALWAGTTNDPSIIMMASSICTLIFDLTSEESLLNRSDFDPRTLESLSQLIIRSLDQDIIDESRDHSDLRQIITAGYRRWAERFPSVRNAVERAVNISTAGAIPS